MGLRLQQARDEPAGSITDEPKALPMSRVDETRLSDHDLSVTSAISILILRSSQLNTHSMTLGTSSTAWCRVDLRCLYDVFSWCSDNGSVSPVGLPRPHIRQEAWNRSSTYLLCINHRIPTESYATFLIWYNHPGSSRRPIVRSSKLAKQHTTQPFAITPGQEIWSTATPS